MRPTIAPLAIAAATAAVVAPASAASGLWWTPAQAEHYVTSLRSWDGIQVGGRQLVRSATCFDGARSAIERRHPRHLGTRRQADGQRLYRSFLCTLIVNTRGFELYVTTTPSGWKAVDDR